MREETEQAEVSGSALEAHGLVKRYGKRAALRGIDFQAQPGELLAVIGPNGAGKTTLLSILAGIVRADEGEVRLPGGEVGWVPQQAALYRRLTVEENLRLFARLEGHSDPEATVREMLELTGLDERRNDQVAPLSGGQPAARQHRDRPARPARRPAPRRAQRRPRSTPAGAAMGVRLGARRRRDDGDLLHPQHPGGGALRTAAAGPRRRRGPVRRHRRKAFGLRSPKRPPRPPTGTSRPPSSPTSSTAVTDHALAAAQGPADPAALAAAGLPAGRLPGADRAAGRLRDLQRPGKAAGRLPQPGAEGDRGPGRRQQLQHRSGPATGSAAGSSASGSNPGRRRSARSRRATCSPP